MSNTNGLLITKDNIYGLINPPPNPDRRDGATRYQDPSSAAVRWDTFVDFSNNFTGGGGGGTLNGGVYTEDSNGNFTITTTPADQTNRDIHGIYFDTSVFDVSFNPQSGNPKLYVDLKPGGGNADIIDISNRIQDYFFAPPKPITEDDINLDTTGAYPRLDLSWNNPLQYRVGFDFLGGSGPEEDTTSIGGVNTRDDYNYLPYFQGLKIQYLCYDGNTPVSGMPWTDVPQAALNARPSSSSGNVGYWNGVGFLPKFIDQMFVYSYTTGTISNYTDLPFGIVFFPNWSGNTRFPAGDKNGYAFSLPQFCPNTSPSVPTGGKNVQLRIAMVNRARTSIYDPSYVSHNLSPATDVSWNWVYLPDPSGMAIGVYGAPTAPLTFTIPSGGSLSYDQFTLNGQNDNDGTNNVSSTPVVETSLNTQFSVLSATNQSLPKVRYRYDLSGHRLSTSKQIGGNVTLIDISKNLPDTDISANWYPSTTNPNSTPNTWTDVVNRSRDIVYPEHKYDIYGYSMRYNLDPSHNDGVFDDYRDASLNSVVTAITDWSTSAPTINDVTDTDNNDGFRETLPDTNDGTYFTEQTSTGWTQNKYASSLGGIAAFLSTYTTRVGLLFLNDGNDPAYSATTIECINSTYTYNIRANSDDFLGIHTSGNEIIRMDSNIIIAGTTTSHTTDLDLSGVQTGFQAVNNSPGLGYDAGGAATNPTNQYLEWKTTDISNVYDLGDSLREGGYFCGTTFKEPKIKNVSLTTYPDISNNGTGMNGYRIIIYQELSGNSGWVRYPSASGGWKKTFSPATRPIEDIEIKFSGNTLFTINDGYDGTGTYEGGGRTNKFKFGSTSTTASNPTKNFFGIPMLANSSTSVIDYKISLENLDLWWWPKNNNLLDDVRIYFKGTGTGTAPSSTNFINWQNQNYSYPWTGAAPGIGSFPRIPSNSYPIQTITNSFNFGGTTSTSFGGNKYSRDLMDTGYTPSITTPLFFIEATYDNNIKRLNRGGSNLEVGTRRSLDAACVTENSTQPINRFAGRGVGPNGSYTLFWDYTFNATVTFQNVGEIGSSPYNQYPFCEISTSPDFASQFSHSTIMSGVTAQKQLMWAKNGFKHGQWSTASENPYINYTSKYWFGNHTPSALAVDYSTYQSTGETIGTIARTYDSADFTPWYDNSTPNSFTIDTGPYKVLVVKIQKPTGFSTSQQPCCSLELKLDGTYVRWPDVTPTQAANGSKPLVWMLEDQGSTVTTFAVSTGYNSARTGWKATHKREDTAGQGAAIMNENNMGCTNTTALHTSAGDNQGVKVFDLTGGKSVAYDIYFRILIPNSNTSTSNNLSAIRVAFYNRSGSTVSSAISGQTVTKDWSQ